MRVNSKKTNPVITGKQTVHNVHILDRSGSMIGSKYNNAISSIKDEILSIKNDDDVNYTLTIVEFDSQTSHIRGLQGYGFIEKASGSEAEIIKHNFLTPIEEYKDFKAAGARGGTPLYETVGTIIEELLTKVKSEDKVIITITTDGAENTSFGKYSDPKVLKELLDKVQAENNFTITFIGTEYDVDRMISTMNISKGNTLVHKNTGESFRAVYSTRTNSLKSYSKSVASGEIGSVTLDFFKSVEEK